MLEMIPDPIEQMDERMEELAWEWAHAQEGVGPDQFRCPYCKKVCKGEPIQANERPDSPFMCYDCLPDDMKRKYDAVFGNRNKGNGGQGKCLPSDLPD